MAADAAGAEAGAWAQACRLTGGAGAGAGGRGCVYPSPANLSQPSSCSREREAFTLPCLGGRRPSVQGGAGAPYPAGLSHIGPGLGQAPGSIPGAVRPLGRKLRASAARDAGARDGGRHGLFLS